MLTALEGFASDQADYASPEPEVQLSGEIQYKDGEVSTNATGGQIGYVYRRRDGLRVVQVRPNRLAYSWTGQYEGWDVFVEEFMKWWERYRSVIRPTELTRIGVRYVNKIDIPSVPIEIKDYLRTGIDVSPYLPQMVAGYYMQVVVPIRDSVMAQVISTILPPGNPEATSLILDIDTSDTEPVIAAADADNQAIQKRLDNLRDCKNYVFEACITDATRRLID